MKRGHWIQYATCAFAAVPLPPVQLAPLRNVLFRTVSNTTAPVNEGEEKERAVQRQASPAPAHEGSRIYRNAPACQPPWPPLSLTHSLKEANPHSFLLDFCSNTIVTESIKTYQSISTHSLSTRQLCC